MLVKVESVPGQGTKKARMKLLVDPEKVWFQIKVPDMSRVRKRAAMMSEDELAALRSRASKLYEEQTKKYREQCEMTPADRTWLETVLSKGTQSDKISAMLIQVRECPFYGLDWIAQLLVLSSSPTRSESYRAVDALRDIFLLILPPKSLNRPLVPWKSRPLSDDKELTPSWVLVLAYFEDILRQSYQEYIKILEIMLHDQIQNGRERTMRIVFDLALAHKSEQTESLMALLVNKLGDPQRKVSSRVVYYLQCIVDKSEELTLPIVKLVQKEATNANNPNDKPAFYGLTFFSQLRLSEDSPEVTQVLLETYQHFLHSFIRLLESNARAKKKIQKTKRRKTKSVEEEEIPREIKVVLTGLMRAVPFAESGKGKGIIEYASKLLSIAQSIRSFPTLLQATILIFKIFSQTGLVEQSQLELLSSLVSNTLLDYSRLCDCTSSHPPLFKLLYKIFTAVAESNHSMSISFLRKMLKSLLAVATIVPNPAFPAAALLLVNEAISMKPGLRLSLNFPDDGETRKQGDLLWEINLLRDHYHPTVSRYAKRLLVPNGYIDLKNEPEDPFASMASSFFLEGFIKGTLSVS